MGSKKRISVVIASDLKLYREGLRALLHYEERIEVVGDAATGPQTINAIDELRPDIVLLDMAIPGGNDIQIIHSMREKSPKTKVLLFPLHRDGDLAFKSMGAGSRGYIPKETGVGGLVKALCAVQSGRMWVERKLLAKFFDIDGNPDVGARGKLGGREDRLTQKEGEVLRLLTTGYTNREIAHALLVSEKTVRRHLNNILRKLKGTRGLEALRLVNSATH